MLFSSISFLFVFLPVLFILLLLFDKKFHNLILFISSIIFYAFEDIRFLPIIFAVILVSYTGAILIDRFETKKKLFVILTLAGNLGMLFYFKYFNFAVDIFNQIMHLSINLPKVVLPLGISFYTFQAISYVLDVYRKEVHVQKNLYKFSLYICLFPQLIAGPIIKYHDIESYLDLREITFEDVSIGVKRFILGLAKKVLIANTMGQVANLVFSQSPIHLSPYIAWLGAFAYTFQIYFDFSGYSDMAIGLGRILGFKFMENFNYPYISGSITEFWRRWHISLSSWFKHYVYIPLGGNKGGLLKTIRNLGLVFLLTGIWHGAAWNFILWGIWHGFFIIVEKIINIKEIEEKGVNLWQKILMHSYCLFVVIVGWVLFNSENVRYAIKYIKNMLFLIPASEINEYFTIHYYIDTKEIIVFVAAILCCTPLFKNILDTKTPGEKVVVNTWLLILFLFSVMAIAADTYNTFIYFRF